MPRRSKLTPQQWQAVRCRWEGCPVAGFGWLTREIATAWGIGISRAALGKVACAQGWAKGGPPAQPLQPAQPGAQPAAQPPAAEPDPAVTPPPYMRATSADTALTAQEESFVRELALGASQTDAYLAAFANAARWTRQTVHEAASRLAATSKISTRLQQVLAAAAARAEIDVAEVLRQYRLRLHADPRELVTYRVSACRYCWSPNGRWQFTAGELEQARERHEEKRERALAADKPDPGEFDEKGGGGYSRLLKPRPDCPECAGDGIGRAVFKDLEDLSEAGLAIFAGVREGRDGTEIKLADRDAALEKLARHVRFFEDDEPPVIHAQVHFEQLEGIYEAARAKLEAERVAMQARAQRLRDGLGPAANSASGPAGDGQAA